jgi:hypothetical protein
MQCVTRPCHRWFKPLKREMVNIIHMAYCVIELFQPWLTTKKHFIILSLIVLGPESIIGNNIDIYLEPIVEELKKLCETRVHA